MENMLSGLERMVEYDLIVVLKYLTKKDKMSLRESSTTLRRRIDELEKTFKVWRISDVDKNKLRTIADINIIQGNNYFKYDKLYKVPNQVKMFVKINVKETPPLSRANFIVLIYFHHFIKLEIPIQFFSKIITVRNPVFKQKYFIIFFKFVHVTIKSKHHCTYFICTRLN